MKIDFKNKREKIYTAILLLIFFSFLLYNFNLILTKLNPYFIESDLINEITYRQQCYQQKTLFPDDFTHSNELFATRPVLLYYFFYNITQNFLFSYQLETMVMLVVLLSVTVFLCKCIGVKNNSIIFILIVFLIWMPELTKNVLWLEHDAYSLFAITVFLTFAFRILWRKGIYKKFSVICCMVLSAYMGLLTLKMSMVLYIPLLMADLWILAGNHNGKRKLKKTEIHLTLISACQLVVNLLFYKVCLMLFSDKFTPVAMRIADMETMFSWNNFKSRFLELAGIFGMYTLGGEILSGKNILFMLYGIAFLLMAAVICTLLKKYNAEGGFQLEIVLFVFSVLIFNFILLFVLAYGSSYRYYFSAILFVPVLLGVWVDGLEQKEIVKIVSTVSVLLFGGGVINNYSERFVQMELPLLNVAEYVEEMDYSYVVATYWNAAAIKGYLNGQVEAAHIPPVCNALTPSYWMIDKNVFLGSKPGEIYALILTETEYKNMTDSFTQILLDKYPIESTIIDQYYILTYAENPFLLMNQIKEKYNAGLPKPDQDYKIVYANNSDLLCKDAKLDDSNVLVSDGKQTGYIMYGPYTESIAGNYNITLNYTVEYLNGISTDSKAAFDVALDSQTCRGIICESDENSATLENVSIDAGHKFEIRVFAPRGIRIHVYSVEYERLHES